MEPIPGLWRRRPPSAIRNSIWKRLTGEPFVSIDRDQDTSRQGKRKFWIVDSDEQNFKTGQQLAEQFVEAGLTVLAFCPSRMVAEQMLG
ncbi:MAG: hypothetical protein R3C11_27645 [Planctomycetaceae bacterium]